MWYVGPREQAVFLKHVSRQLQLLTSAPGTPQRANSTTGTFFFSSARGATSQPQLHVRRAYRWKLCAVKGTQALTLLRYALEGHRKASDMRHHAVSPSEMIALRPCRLAG